MSTPTGGPGNDDDQQPQQPSQPAARAEIRVNGTDNKDVQTITIMPSNARAVFALKDGKKDSPSPLISSDDSMPTVRVADGKEVKVDFSQARQGAAGSNFTREVTIETDSRSKVTLTGFTGEPPVRIAPGSKVAVEATSLMGLNNPAARGPDGKSVVTTAKVEFQRGQDGSLIVLRDGKPAMTIPKDTKVDILDEKGNKLMTLDSSKDVEETKAAYLKAEKAAFSAFQSNSPDSSVKNATMRSGSEPPPPQQGAQPAQPGMLSNLGTMAQQTAGQLGLRVPTNATELAQQAIPGIQRITGGGRTTGGGTNT